MRLERARAKSRRAFATLPFAPFCAQYLKIQDKDGDIVRLHLKPVQRQLVANLTGRDLVLKARQVGVSTGIQALHFYEQMQGNTRTSTLCHEDDLTKTLRQMSDLFYDELPESVKPSRQYANAKQTVYDELRSSGNIATVGGSGGRSGKKKGRGGSYTRIHGSEVAYWPDAKSVLAAAMQAGDPAIVLESTANGMVGWFYELCMEAIDGDSIWTLHFIAWWDEPEYRIALEPGEALSYTDEEQALVAAHGLDAEQIKWRRYKKKELKSEFPQEYPEDPYSCFLASGQSYFGDVEHVFTAPDDADPLPRRRYVAGLDFGQTVDFTVMKVLDTVVLEEVDQVRIRQMSWLDQRHKIAEMARKWNNCTVWAEWNSMGDPNIEELQRMGVRVEPFKTTSATKPPLIQGLYVAIHEAGLKLRNDGVTPHEFRAFISKQTASGHWQYEAQEGAHDDTVMAAALMWHGHHAQTATVTRVPQSGLYRTGGRRTKAGPRT